jgi:hypothetical protein
MHGMSYTSFPLESAGLISNGGRSKSFLPFGELGEEFSLITLPELAAAALGSFLAQHMSRSFGSTHAALTELVTSAARLALERIGNSDALYHNVEHTTLVTLAGYDIMKGRALLKQTDASDFAHLIVACLFHDIGYVRGIFEKDGDDGYVMDGKGGNTKFPRGSSDAALLTDHVDRSKLFVINLLGDSKLLDANRIARAIEYTRFPSVQNLDDTENEEGLLVRAADFVGQFGDPHYLPKAAALYYEFEQVGMNQKLGYASPVDLTEQFPRFYRNSISVHVQRAMRYLNVTSSGRKWIARIYSNLERAQSTV